MGRPVLASLAGMGHPAPRHALCRTTRLAGAAAALLLPSLHMAASISKTPFGTMPDGTTVDLYTLTNAGGMVCKVITYGAAITELHVPDREGKLGDVVLGFDNLAQYVSESPCFGAVVGRVANRIARGRFKVDGKTYQLAINNPPNTLHGGLRGFDKVVWGAQGSDGPGGPSVAFSHVSPDGDQGFPGALTVRMTYTLTDRNEVRFDYQATTDRTTPVNLANHSYFNLACGGDVRAQVLQLKASKYTPTDAGQIPTGVIADVAGGPLDFTLAKPIGRDLERVPGNTRGYDHNFVIDAGGRGVVLAALARDPASGRSMEVLTDQPGVQLYTGNNLDGSIFGKHGDNYPIHCAFCLETQHYPDSVNHPGFPSTLLHPGETFRSTTVYRFSAR
jgi:aldose 1-epimerase